MPWHSLPKHFEFVNIVIERAYPLFVVAPRNVESGAWA